MVCSTDSLPATTRCANLRDSVERDTHTPDLECLRIAMQGRTSLVWMRVGNDSQCEWEGRGVIALSQSGGEGHRAWHAEFNPVGELGHFRGPEELLCFLREGEMGTFVL